MTDLNVVPELVAAYAVTTIDNKEASVGGIYRTVGMLSSAKNKVAASGIPSVFPLPNSRLLLTEDDPEGPRPLKLISTDSGGKWTAEDNPAEGLSDLRSIAVIGDVTLGVTGRLASVVKIDTSESPWKAAKTYLHDPKAVVMPVGRHLGIAGKHAVAIFNSIAKVDTPDEDFDASQLVVLDPATLDPVEISFGGSPVYAIPLGKNATALDILKDKNSDVWDILVACAGGKQGTPKGNGQNSRLDLVTLTQDAKGGFQATSRTLLTGYEGGNDIQSVAVSPLNGEAFILATKLKGFNEETGKAQVGWDLYSTTLDLLKLIDNKPISILGVPVQRNICDFEEGHVWDLLHSAKFDELWMGHGNDIYIYRLTDRDPWGDPDAFCQEDMNKDPLGNLQSFCVQVEAQGGFLVKEFSTGPKAAISRGASLRELAKLGSKKL